jgi:hypothetical protein
MLLVKIFVNFSTCERVKALEMDRPPSGLEADLFIIGDIFLERLSEL